MHAAQSSFTETGLGMRMGMLLTFYLCCVCRGGFSTLLRILAALQTLAASALVLHGKPLRTCVTLGQLQGNCCAAGVSTF